MKGSLPVGCVTGAGLLFSESWEAPRQASASFCSRSGLFPGSGGSLRYLHLSGMSVGGTGRHCGDALLHWGDTGKVARCLL